jgi:hypothetical protein
MMPPMNMIDINSSVNIPQLASGTSALQPSLDLLDHNMIRTMVSQNLSTSEIPLHSDKGLFLLFFVFSSEK